MTSGGPLARIRRRDTHLRIRARNNRAHSIRARSSIGDPNKMQTTVPTKSRGNRNSRDRDTDNRNNAAPAAEERLCIADTVQVH